MSSTPRWRIVRRQGRDMRALERIIIAAMAMTTLVLLLALEGQIWLEGRLQQLEQHGLLLLPSQTELAELTRLADHINGKPAIEAEILSPTQRQQQIAFWLGDVPLDVLPLPQAIRLHFTRPLDGQQAQSLESELAALAEDSQFMLHGSWGGSLRQLVRLGQLAALLTSAALLLALIASITLACRARLAAHHTALALLPMLGATPAFLARHFSWQFFRITLLAAIIGFLIAWLVVLVARSLLFLVLEIRPLLWLPEAEPVFLLALAGLPLLCALIALLTARRQVFLWLTEMELA